MSWFLYSSFGCRVPRCSTPPPLPHTAHGYSFLMAVSCFATPTTKTHAKHSCILHRSLSVHSVSSYSFRLALHSLAFAVPLPLSYLQGALHLVGQNPSLCLGIAYGVNTSASSYLVASFSLFLLRFSSLILRAVSRSKKQSCTQNELLGARVWSAEPCGKPQKCRRNAS